MPSDPVPSSPVPPGPVPSVPIPPDRCSARHLPRRRALALLVLAPLVGACGHGHHHHHEGDVVVDNRSDLSIPDDVDAFRLAAFGQPFSGNLIAAPIDPGDSRFIGTFEEDFYDAEADLAGGEIVEWFDEFVGDEETTTFVVP